MKREQVDVFVPGGGIAGLVTAAAFGHTGFSVLLADPAPPPLARADPGIVLRSTAFLRPALQLFCGIGLWDVLGPVEIHRVRMTVAPIWTIASKLVSVLHARMAMRLNSLSF
ncbi:MAG: hypothetical protein GY717_05435 [Rhodobacteraceae bacterium]|nr:hypothetical protein [Paracoccaceae bacterium]